MTGSKGNSSGSMADSKSRNWSSDDCCWVSWDEVDGALYLPRLDVLVIHIGVPYHNLINSVGIGDHTSS